MELKNTSLKFNVMWKRWSEYEIKSHPWGGEYIVPTKNAEAIDYNCTEQPEKIVADALEVGRVHILCLDGRKESCLAFAHKYGLLGLWAETREHYSEEQACPPDYRALNSKEYGENLSGFSNAFMLMYQHFKIAKGQEESPYFPRSMDLAGNIHYRLTCGSAPQIVWEVYSMLSVLHFMYATIIAENKDGLRICKNCGKIYYNTHSRSEFCGTKCRNYYNVKRYREREQSR